MGLLPGPRLLATPELWFGGGESVWTVEFQGRFSLVRFQLESTERSPDGRFALPEAIDLVYRRSERRVAAPPSTSIRFRRERSPQEFVERPLRDVCLDGLQFVTETPDDIIPGEQLLAAEIRWKHGGNIAVTAEVRHVSNVDASKHGLCGVRVAPRTVQDAHAWYQELSNLLYPETWCNPAHIEPQQIWSLYVASGYFTLDGRGDADFDHVKTDFIRANKRLVRAPDISCQVVREHRGRVQVAVSLARAWSHAWLSYQVARTQEGSPLALSGNAVLHSVFVHAYEAAQQHPETRWHVVYVRKDARFSKLAYYDFAAPRVDDTRVSIVPFRAIQVRCQPHRPHEAWDRAEVSDADSSEIARALEAFARRFPPPYLEAYDLVPERADLAACRQAWHRASLQRVRRWLVARERGLATSAAVLDMITQGVHLVGLLNSVHLIALQPEGREHFGQLLRAAQRICHDEGQREFVYFDEALAPPPPALPTHETRDMGVADQIFLSSAAVPEFLDHIGHVTSPRLALL